MSESKTKTVGVEEKPPNDYQLAAMVARHVELRNVNLISMAAELKAPLPEAVRAMSAGSVDAALDWKTQHALTIESHTLSVVARYNVKVLCKVPDQERPRELVVVTATFELDYGLAVPPPEGEREAMLAAFARINGIYNCWPYVRELVQNTCARMALPPVILPVYRARTPPKKVPSVSKA